jgi:uncharacterized protein YrrD
METHAVQLGWDVFSRDGEKLGSVDRLVLNSENQHLEALVVDEGFFSTGKLIDLDLVAGVEGDRVVLSLPTAQTEQLPEFVSTQFVDAPAEALTGYPGLASDAVGPGTVPYGGPLIGAGYPSAGMPAYVDDVGIAPVVENVRNIPEQDVVVDSGSDVVGLDGKKVGTVDRVVYGQGGAVQEVVVKSGFLFKHEVTIPGEWVAELDEDQIRLSVTAEEAEAQGAA